MTEKEKMLNEEIYNPNYDSELIKERTLTQDMCFEYNNIKPSFLKERDDLIRKIIFKTGKNVLIEQPFWCDYGYNIELGDNFYSNHGLTILDGGRVKFGNNVFIGPNCSFYTAGHPIDYIERNKGLEYVKPIIVGDNVWFGGNVTVIPGVKIGTNVVIGAGSVVVKDIPSNVVAVGNPCSIIRYLNDEE